MNIIVCGGRVGIKAFYVGNVLTAIAEALKLAPGQDKFWHGNADGTDKFAGAWAKDNGYEVEAVRIDNTLDGHRDNAPKQRNIRMKIKSQATLVICFPGGPGSRHMMDAALADPACTVLDVDLNWHGKFEVWNIRNRPAQIIVTGPQEAR